MKSCRLLRTVGATYSMMLKVKLEDYNFVLLELGVTQTEVVYRLLDNAQRPLLQAIGGLNEICREPGS